MLLGKRIHAVVPAAGKGRRMEGTTAKQFLELQGKPILVHTLQRLSSIPEIDELVVAAAEDDRAKIEHLVAEYRIAKIGKVIIGGNERQDSVWNCLQQLSGESDDLVLVHDAVRPFVTRDLVVSVSTAAVEVGAAIPVLSPRDTIKTLNGNGFIKTTLNRHELVMVQTPQAFRFSVVFEAYRQAMNDRFYGTDDAGLVERSGGKVKVVDGLLTNIKITTPEDMLFARHIAQ